MNALPFQLLAFIVATVGVVVAPGFATAADSRAAIKKALENCTPYRAKRAHVPVYREADSASGSVRALRIGEKVCYVGEQNGFAIVDWSKQDLINGTTKAIPPENAKRLLFVRLSDLWEPKDDQQGLTVDDPLDVTEKGKQYLFYLRNGILTEDALAPLRPLLAPFLPSTECKAGKICEKVLDDIKSADGDED